MWLVDAVSTVPGPALPTVPAICVSGVLTNIPGPAGGGVEQSCVKRVAGATAESSADIGLTLGLGGLSGKNEGVRAADARGDVGHDPEHKRDGII